MIVIPIENQHAYHSIPRNKDLQHHITNSCDAPNRVLVVDWKGDCFICGCEAWLPISVGKVENFSRLADVWASLTARYLQEDIAGGHFTHCAVDRCGVQDRDITHDQYLVSINIDESCNLRCPSCRKDSIMITSGADFDRKLQQVDHMVDLLEAFDPPCKIVMSGNGDPLASAIMRPLIHRWQPRDDHRVRLFTNGLLLRKQLTTSAILNHVDEYFLSIDAGSQEVYERVRLGGSWAHLLENLYWLREQCSIYQSRVLLMLVLQRDNYHDLENFCHLVVDFGFQGSVTYLEDWGTWSDFAQHDVIGNANHALHDQAMQHLSDCYRQFKNRINFGSRLQSLMQ